MQKPSKDYSFLPGQDIYNATRLQLAATPSSSSTPTSTSLNSPPATSQTSGSTGLSRGAIAGIVLGALVGIALILGGILLLLRRRKTSQRGEGIPDQSQSMTAAGHYDYNSMTQASKDTYAYQPAELRTSEQPIELGPRDHPSELPADNGVAGSRH